MPGIDFVTLRKQIPMQRVLELLDYQPRSRASDQIRGPCPVHQSTSPTSRIFSANIARNTFQCFKCGAKGNQLDLWAQVHDLNIYEAAVDLCRQLNLEPPRLK